MVHNQFRSPASVDEMSFILIEIQSVYVTLVVIACTAKIISYKMDYCVHLRIALVRLNV